jgi:hypothetical protein
VEVKSVGSTLVQSEFGPKYRFASFRLLRVLKGKARRPLDNIGVTPDIWVGGPGVVHNSAIDLLNPGRRLLLFSGSSVNIDEPCEAVAGTESAVQAIESALSASKP